ncbi:MAG: NAD(P)/FAD-dependent oxidoreductase [Gammaproteobacteria bacterium]
MKIAVVGTGIAGLSAAWLLRRHADVTVYEQNPYAGGHTHTFQVPEGPAVDTGFIVFNERNYPHLSALFRHLDVGSQESEMSFAASIGGGRVEYAGDNLNTLFAQRWNLFSRSHWRMLLDIARFNRDARRALRSGLASELSLGEFILSGGYGDELSRRYLLPMAAAIWSCPVGAMLKFPAASFLKFFENHGLLGLMDRPRWRTVTGGSQEYVKKLLVSLGERVRLDTPVTGLRRVGASVRVWDSSGAFTDYDRVVMAVHADQVLPLLAGANSTERRIFSAFKYQDNRVVLHSDPSLMPRRKSVWASWNYLSDDVVDGRARVSVTYWMNRLQHLSGDTDYFVSLNPLTEPKHTIFETTYAHPVFTRESMQAQEQLAAIQGMDRIWFCGAWSGYGFHEDGLRSAVDVVQRMGHPIPWLGVGEAVTRPRAAALHLPQALPGEA